MLLLYINSSILYFYNIWSLLMSSHGYTGKISSSDVVQGGSLLGTLRSAKDETPVGAGHWRELASLLPSVCPHRCV